MIEHPFLKPSLVFNLQKRKLKGELLLERPPECCARDLGVDEELPFGPDKRPVHLLIRNPHSEAPVQFPNNHAQMTSSVGKRHASNKKTGLRNTFAVLRASGEMRRIP